MTNDKTRINIPRIMAEYYTVKPTADEAEQCVSFGTSGHRGIASNGSFNEAHIAAITQAVCEYRKAQRYTGPLFMGMDTHALSEAAQRTALEVLAAHEVTVFIQEQGGYTPTPVISHAILSWNKTHRKALADGIVITPSHNPPEHGGFKYNPPHGGPAGAECTKVIEARANELLRQNNRGILRISYKRAVKSVTILQHNFIPDYVNDLINIIDMDAIAHSSLRIAADPLGGSSMAYWEPIAERYNLNITVQNAVYEPDFRFMPLDKDGKIRMDCSSPYAMQKLIDLRGNFDLAFGNDPDADRHGIVTPSGLMNPNHYLAVAIEYLCTHRPLWSKSAAIGKTLVSSSIIDRVAAKLGRKLMEVPVGFKWFVEGLFDASCVFGGEESAGASFLRKDGTVWSTDKDGIIMDLLAAEIMAQTGKDPATLYSALTKEFGEAHYSRIQAPANSAQKRVLKNLQPSMITGKELAGETITGVYTHAQGNGAAIGGLKVCTQNAWFAARPSGTEDIYKIYAESFLGKEHLLAVQKEAQNMVNAVLGV